MNNEELSRKMQKGLLEICEQLRRLVAYPQCIHMIYRFVTPPQSFSSQDDSVTSTRKSTFSNNNNNNSISSQQQEEALLRNGYTSLHALAQSLRGASTDQVWCAVTLGSRGILTRAEMATASKVFPGVEWDVTKAIVQTYLLQGLLSNYSSVQVLFRIVPDTSCSTGSLGASSFSLVSPEQQQQTLETLAAFLRDGGARYDWEAVRRAVFGDIAGGGIGNNNNNNNSAGESRAACLARVLGLTTAQMPLCGPLLAFLSLNAEEVGFVRDVLPRFSAVQIFQVSRLRSLSEVEIIELKSLLKVDYFAQQQQPPPPHKQLKITQAGTTTTATTATATAGIDGSSASIPFLSFDTDTPQQQQEMSMVSDENNYIGNTGTQQQQQQQQPIPLIGTDGFGRNSGPQTMTQAIQASEAAAAAVGLYKDDLDMGVQQQQQQQQQIQQQFPLQQQGMGMGVGDSSQQLQLTIIEQPPERCVYKRNIKPGPTVVVSGGSTGDLTSLAVAILLYRCDTNTNESRNLSGNAPIDVTPSRVVVFRRLKILSTSHQLSETLFVLRFELRRYRNGPVGVGDYEVLNVATSTPINVVSHSTQLRTLSATSVPTPIPPAAQQQQQQQSQQQQGGDMTLLTPGSPGALGGGKRPHDAVGAVTVSEIIPAMGVCCGGTRVAILGSNFSNSPSMRVLFGTVEVVPIFYAPGTITCVTPEHAPGTVSVRVCNIPKCWSESAASFTYEDTSRTLRGVTQQSSQFSGLTTVSVLKSQRIQQQQNQHPIIVNPAGSPPPSSQQQQQQPAPMDVERQGPLSPTVGNSPQRVINNIHLSNLSKDLFLPSPKTFDSGNGASNLIISSPPLITSASNGNSSNNANNNNNTGNASLSLKSRTVNTNPLCMNQAPLSSLVSQQQGSEQCNNNNNNNSNNNNNGKSETEIICEKILSGNFDELCRMPLTPSGVNSLDDRGFAPLHYIATATSVPRTAIEAIIRAGGDINVRDKYANTPIHWAAMAGNPAGISNLLALGADPSAQNYDGETPLHAAASIHLQTSVQCCRALIAAGASPNTQENSRSETPLHRAAAENNADIITVLLEAGANINARDEDSYTPLHTAVMAGAINVIRTLLRGKADPNATTSDGETALQIADSLGNKEVHALLVSAGANTGLPPLSRPRTRSTPAEVRRPFGVDKQVPSYLSPLKNTVIIHGTQKPNVVPLNKDDMCVETVKKV